MEADRPWTERWTSAGLLDVSHRSGGLYRLLEHAFVYDRLLRLLGATAARRRFAREILQPKPGDRILDVGCGPGLLLDDLPGDVDYVGFDLNSRYIESARRRHGGRGRFFCARVEEARAETLGSGFDLVVAKSILHHLDDREALALIDMAHRVLAVGGTLVTIDCVLHPGQHAISRLIIACDRGRRVRTAEGYERLVRTRFAKLSSQLVTDLLAVPYSHFVMRAERGRDGGAPRDPVSDPAAGPPAGTSSSGRE